MNTCCEINLGGERRRGGGGVGWLGTYKTVNGTYKTVKARFCTSLSGKPGLGFWPSLSDRLHSVAPTWGAEGGEAAAG